MIRVRPYQIEDEIEANGRLDSDPDNPGSEYIKGACSAWARLINKVYELSLSV